MRIRISFYSDQDLDPGFKKCPYCGDSNKSPYACVLICQLILINAPKIIAKYIQFTTNHPSLNNSEVFFNDAFGKRLMVDTQRETAIARENLENNMTKQRVMRQQKYDTCPALV